MSKPADGCVICNEPITPENDSVEHVIPQAIGGRWIVKGFICQRCNNRSGECWDAVLTKQFEWLSSILGIQRERGSSPQVPMFTMGGESLYLRSDGGYVPRRPEVKKTPDGSTFKVSITGRSMREVRQQAHALKKKYPEAKVEEALANAKMTRRYIEDAMSVKLQFGGHEANASMIKTALAAAFSFGVPLSACDRALDYIRTLHGTPPIHFFLDRDLVHERPADRFLHVVSIQTFPAQRRALAYVDCFGLWRSVVVLSTTYEGAASANTYAFDPIRAECVELNVDVSLTDAEVQAVLDGDTFPNEAWISLYGEIMPKVIARAEQRHVHRAIDEAIDEAAVILGLSGELTLDQQEAYVRLASRLIAERVTEMVQAKAKILGVPDGEALHWLSKK